LIKMMRGDLDWVVMKCLEKDRGRRYDTAAQLTAEIQRFLANEPVMARPPSNLYRFQKLVRRNRLAFAAGSAILASLIIGLCVTSWFFVKEKQQRELAEKASENSDHARRIAEEALEQASASRKQSDVDLKHTKAAQQQSDLALSRAAAAEKKAEASQKDADTARQQAETALQQAREDREKASLAEQAAKESQAQAQAALQQAREDRNKASLAEQAAKDSQAQAQTARQQAQAAEARAVSETAKREEATKAVASELGLVQQATAVATAAQAEIAQSRETISNSLSRLDALPPADALKAASLFFAPGDEKKPWAARFLRERGGWRARQGDWGNAVADFSKALDLEPANPQSYDALAPLLVQNGEWDAFGRHCAKFLARFGGTNDAAIARLMARDCLFAPLPGVDIGPVAAWARLAIETGTNDNSLYNSQLTLALAEYRQRHYAEAADRAGKALAGSGPDADCAAQACAAMAMAQQQLKQTDAAHATLATGRQIVETKLAKLESGDIGPEWRQWIMAHALMREATALIDVQPAAK
jgi:chemotaxis protein histidine kinase CheA